MGAICDKRAVNKIIREGLVQHDSLPYIVQCNNDARPRWLTQEPPRSYDMKAVDVLIQARKFLSNRKNWTRYTMYRSAGHPFQFSETGYSFKEGSCCAIGAVALKSGCAGKKYNGIRDSLDVGQRGYSVFVGEPGTILRPVRADEAPKGVIKSLLAEGVHLKAGDKAIKYLRAASIKLYNTDIVSLNDDGAEGAGYDAKSSHKAVLAAFDLAIKNAKRRHINGKRFASQV